LTILGFRLFKNNFRDVRSKLGPAALSHPIDGSGHESPHQICYVAENGDGTDLVLEAGWATNWTALSGFTLTSGRGPKSKAQCKKSSSVYKDISTPNGLRLGLTKVQLISILGKPTRVSGETFYYDLCSRRRMSKKELANTVSGAEADPYWDICNSIQADFGLPKR
jgi:hypothetical protein